MDGERWKEGQKVLYVVCRDSIPFLFLFCCVWTGGMCVCVYFPARRGVGWAGGGSSIEAFRFRGFFFGRVLKSVVRTGYV